MVGSKICSMCLVQEFLVPLHVFIINIFTLVWEAIVSAIAAQQRAQAGNSEGELIFVATRREQSINCIGTTFAVPNVENAPVLPNFLGLRVAGYIHENDGWLKNIADTQSDDGQSKNRPVRTILRFVPMSNVIHDLKFSYGNVGAYSSGGSYQAIGTNLTTGDRYVRGLNDNFTERERRAAL